jgi:hypothetical protein
VFVGVGIYFLAVVAAQPTGKEHTCMDIKQLWHGMVWMTCMQWAHYMYRGFDGPMWVECVFYVGKAHTI